MNARQMTAAVITALTLALVGACSDDGGGEGGEPAEPTATQTTASASPTSSPTASATPTPTPTETAEPVEVTAWYLVDTRAGVRLARELRSTAGADPVRAAVELMIAGAADPDYTTAWNPATRVLGVSRDSGGFVVDLSEEARTASVGSEAAAMMVQQLVHTVTDTAEDQGAGVLLTIGGQPAGDLWGSVSWTEPVTRAAPLDVRVTVQIDRPVEGATTGSPVTVSGDAVVFEATLQWRVLDASGAEVQSGFATTTSGQEFAPYTFTVDLEPGTYTVVVDEGDPSGTQEGGPPMTDSRTITVS